MNGDGRLAASLRPPPQRRCYQCMHALVGPGGTVRCELGYFTGLCLRTLPYRRIVDCALSRFEAA